MKDDAGTRRNGETEIRGQKAAGRDQMAEYKSRLRDVSVGAAFQPRSSTGFSFFVFLS